MARNSLAHNEPYLWNNRYMKFNGKMLHNIIWEEHNGIIPDGFFIHHKNGDKKDNRIENLELTTRAEHCKLHKPRLGFRSPPIEICSICGERRSNKAILNQPHRYKCYKCRTVENRERRQRKHEPCL